MPARAHGAVCKLSVQQIESFHTDGYLALRELTTPDEVARLRVVYDRLFANHGRRGEGVDIDLAAPRADGKAAQLPQIQSPSRLVPELESTQFRLNALEIARQLFGTEVRLRGEHMIFKPARTAPETPWHQDQAYHDPNFTYRNVNFWLPLQDATIENGCMQFVPRSHLQDVLPHRHIGNDPRVHGLVAEESESYSKMAVACPIPAGGATLHHSYMLHYAGPNVTDIPRRAYILVFGLPPVAREARVFPWQMREKEA
jgi:hypothetical protein